MTHPTVAVKVDFTTDRYDTPSYTTLPAADVAGFEIEHGRHSELDGSDPGTLNVALYSDTRTYDPHNASSSHYPNLTPGRKVQVTATYNAVTYELYNGWTTGWPQQYGARTGTATLKALGPFQYLQRASIPDAYQATVLADTPTGYYRMGDAASHSLTDSSGNERHGRWHPAYQAVDTADPLIFSTDKAVKLPGTPAAQLGVIPASVIPALRPLSIEFWMRVDNVPDALTEGLYLGAEQYSTFVIGGGPVVRMWAKTGTHPGSIEWLVCDTADPATGNVATTATSRYYSPAGGGWVNLATGSTVHVVCTFNAAGNDMYIWINADDYTGEIVLDGTVAAIAPWDTTVRLNWAAGWDGDCVIDELAFYAYELSDTQVAAHFEAGDHPGRDDATGERIGRALDLIGWPAGLRDLDAGGSVLGIADMTSTALEYLDVVTATEQGLLSEAHDDGGKLRFQDRAGRLTDTRSTVVQTLFSDQASDIASNDAVVYSRPALATDDRPAANQVTVKWAGGEASAVDQTSVDAYGDIPVTVDTLLETYDEAVNLADWILGERASLFTRIRSITLQPNAHTGTMADRVWVAALSRKVGDRVRVVHQPASTGTAIDEHLYVIGVEHHAANGVGEWETVLHLGPAITTSYWSLGTSQLGTGTRLAY